MVRNLQFHADLSLLLDQLTFLGKVTRLDEDMFSMRNQVLFDLSRFLIRNEKSLLRTKRNRTIPSIFAICPTLPSLDRRASKLSNLGSPPVMSWVLDACRGFWQ